MKTKINKLMAYIYMPLIFTIIGFVLFYIALSPVLNLVTNVGAMVVAEDIPSFTENLESAFVPPAIIDASEQENTIDLSEVDIPSSGTHYAQITCERIGLDAPVYMDDTDAILKVGVGQYLGTSIPGFGKPIMLAAHCTTFFAPFEFIEVGDVVTITTSYGVYEYEITETSVVEPPFKGAYDLAQEEEELIMYTCYPFKLLSGSRQKRLFVYGKKIAGPDIIY